MAAAGESPDDDAEIVALYERHVDDFASLSETDETRLAKRVAAGRAASETLTDSTNRDSEALTDVQRDRLQRTKREGLFACLIMAQSNLRLVLQIAKKYRSPAWPIPIIDLIAAGNAGLVMAVERYDRDDGYGFSPYAIFHVRQSIMRHIAAVKGDTAPTDRKQHRPLESVDESARNPANPDSIDDDLMRWLMPGDMDEMRFDDEHTAELPDASAEPSSASGAHVASGGCDDIDPEAHPPTGEG